MTVHRVESYDESGFGLTPSQQEALAVALEQGYFDVPRTTTLVEIAERLGVSDQAVSERLRRGEKHLLRRALSSVES